MLNTRIKVTIRCNQCGERFILRGKKERGEINTGFKQCVCNNSSDFEVREDSI
jgi:DNA-directed RNA polymerase subunit RPC12/RpoP